MSNVLDNRYRTVMYGSATDNSPLGQEYEKWEKHKEAAYKQVQRFFMLTASLPVIGDRFDLGGTSFDGRLRVENRTLYSIDNSETLLLVYELCSDQIEELEACEEEEQIEE